MPKQRNHNEWFSKVLRGNRKSCPNCGTRIEKGESIWAWYEYHNAKRRHIRDFCKNCFHEQVAQPLQQHADDCGCNISLIVQELEQPAWLRLDTTPKCNVPS